MEFCTMSLTPSFTQPPAKCKECKQLLTSPDLRLFPGDSDDAVSLKTLY